MTKDRPYIHTYIRLCKFCHLATPREGHLEQCLHIFAYLKKYNHSKFVFDDSVPVFDEEWFQQCDWEEFYPGAEEVLPPNAPEAWGKPLTMMCFADADHASCHVMHRSHTGVLILLNKALIIWYSKRQNTVETLMFGSEFIAMKSVVVVD